MHEEAIYIDKKQQIKNESKTNSTYQIKL